MACTSLCCGSIAHHMNTRPQSKCIKKKRKNFFEFPWRLFKGRRLHPYKPWYLGRPLVLCPGPGQHLDMTGLSVFRSPREQFDELPVGKIRNPATKHEKGRKSSGTGCVGTKMRKWVRALL